MAYPVRMDNAVFTFLLVRIFGIAIGSEIYSGYCLVLAADWHSGQSIPASKPAGDTTIIRGRPVFFADAHWKHSEFPVPLVLSLGIAE